jgi:hypothetical protein
MAVALFCILPLRLASREAPYDPPQRLIASARPFLDATIDRRKRPALNSADPSPVVQATEIGSMAKQKMKRTADPLAISLKLLSRADREGLRAARALGKAIELRLKLPDLERCTFKYGSRKYSRRLTPHQCEAILKVVKEQGNVLETVNELLGDLSCAVANCLETLSRPLQISSDTGALRTGGPEPKKLAPLGCCVYTGGQTPNLTQTQCMHYPDAHWNVANPDCTPKGGRTASDS